MAGASRALWKLWTEFRSLRIENDLIRRQKSIDEFNTNSQLEIILKQLLPFLYKHCGHFGMVKTFPWVRERFYWPGMRKDVHEWVSSCKVCCQKSLHTRNTCNVETNSLVLASCLGHYGIFS